MPTAAQSQLRKLALLFVLVLATVFVLNRSARQCATQLPPIVAPEERLGPCLVTRVVDGDTIHVNCEGMRDKVRLLRIDTPERGENGYDEATEALAEMIAGERAEAPEFDVRKWVSGGRSLWRGAGRTTSGSPLLKGCCLLLQAVPDEPVGGLAAAPPARSKRHSETTP